jgi:putative ABC transport system substrate-binding protein
VRRISVVLGAGTVDRDGYLAAFLQGLQQLGWSDGRNVQLDIRRGAGDADDLRNTPRNWPRSRLTLSWHPAPQ